MSSDLSFYNRKELITPTKFSVCKNNSDFQNNEIPVVLSGMTCLIGNNQTKNHPNDFQHTLYGAKISGFLELSTLKRGWV